MTDKLREAAQMALDALDSDNPDIQLRAATALRAALAQPEQEPTRSQKLRDAGYTRRPKGWGKDEEEPEPVACADKYDLDREGHDFWVSRQANVRTGVPLYTAPPQREWQGLTDEEIKNHWLIAMQSVEGTVLPIPEFALAIERALKEKNT